MLVQKKKEVLSKLKLTKEKQEIYDSLSEYIDHDGHQDLLDEAWEIAYEDFLKEQAPQIILEIFAEAMARELRRGPEDPSRD